MVPPPQRKFSRRCSARHQRCVALAIRGLALLALMTLPACSRMVSNAANNMAENLAHAIANNDDPATVKAGAPAYLLMLDGMVYRDPENEALLLQAATLYNSYGAAFVDDPVRARKLSQRALDYATRALCAHDLDDCHLRQAEFELFEARINRVEKPEVPVFYTWGAAWAGWIQVHRDDLVAVAELSRVEAIMQRIAALDEGYRQGSVHLYLGTFAILVPPALGGQPEVAREHFERAIELSAGENLMAKVVYARQYARMVYDRPLHDRLLTEVLAADPDVPELVLQNTLAQEQARGLLATAGDYF
ncbi:MAG: TRAP transporter TatT component family protein [Desulfosarcina sp.]|nr:TRAP transporter TatT component family protein [Desulfobacterales bacterium]